MADCYVGKVVELAKSEVGYKEKATNQYLDDKTNNAGHANFNKYAKYIDDNYPNFYNGPKNGFDWCAVFVDYLFIKSYGYADALRLSCQPEKSYGASCTASMNYFKDKKQFDKIPTIGAQIFFGEKNTSTHTGLVVGINGDKIITVEGNAGDAVCEKSYDKSYSKILGYGHPKYTEEGSKTLTVDVDTSKYKTVILNLV